MSEKLSTIAGRVLVAGQPLLYGAASLLGLFAIVPTSMESLGRPALVVAAISALGLALAWAITRSWAWSGLITSAVVLFTMRELGPFLVITSSCAALIIMAILRRWGVLSPSLHQAPVAVARASGIFSVALAMIALGGAIGTHLLDQPRMTIPEYALSPASTPNIYLILVDGYPRADTLESTFGIDTTRFLDDLRDMGFETSERARTNYNKTWLTLASALNATYVDELLPDRGLPETAPGELLWLHAMIRESSVPAALRDAGYRIRTVPSAYVSTALTTADDYVDEGGLTEFELKLIASSPWTAVFRETVVPFLMGQQRADVEKGLTTTVDLALNRQADPQFVMSHIHSPHPPFVLAGRGEPPTSLPNCFPGRCSFWEARVANLMIPFDDYRVGLQRQVESLNSMLTRALGQIVASDPGAIVILMSDHGTRYSLDDTDEHYRSLLSARTPGHPGLFAEDESPVNVFRRLFSAYFAADLPPLPYRSWDLDWRYNLRLTERDAG